MENYGDLAPMRATEIEFFKPVKGKLERSQKGAIPFMPLFMNLPWTIILNKDHDTWGAFKYDMKKYIAQVVITVQKNTKTTEAYMQCFLNRRPPV